MKKAFLLFLILFLPIIAFAEDIWFTFLGDNDVIVVTHKEIPFSEMLTEANNILSSFQQANPSFNLQLGKTFQSFKQLNEEMYQHIEVHGEGKVTFINSKTSDATAWEETFTKGQKEVKVSEAELLIDHPSRSQITPDAYETEIGNRWLVRFSSKRPSYRTYADWLVENKNTRIDIHPEDAERLAQTNEGKLELAKIYEHNERFKKGGSLSNKEIGCIMNRTPNEYGLVESPQDHIARFQPDHFNPTTFNDVHIFNTRINPYNFTSGKLDNLLMEGEPKAPVPDIAAYRGEKFFQRMKFGGYYAWFCGILMTAGAAFTVVQILRDIVTIHIPNGELFGVWYRSVMNPIFYGNDAVTQADKDKYLKSNSHAWMLKEQGSNQGFSIHNQCTYSQSNLATNFKR